MSLPGTEFESRVVLTSDIGPIVVDLAPKIAQATIGSGTWGVTNVLLLLFMR